MQLHDSPVPGLGRHAAGAARPASAVLLFGAFIFVHVLLALVGKYAPGWVFGDVASAYYTWTRNALASGEWPGITVGWVYPVVALVPMLLPWLLPGVTYTTGWMVWVLVFDLLALLVFTRGGRDARRVRIAWFWVAYLVALGPIAIGRIDAMCVPLALVALDWLRRRPAVAGALLAVGGWMKIWPVALFGAAFVALRSRWRLVLGAAVFSAAVVAFVAVAGDPANIFSFVSGQTSRQLQVEAVAATPWLWVARFVPSVSVAYNYEILTWEVLGPGAVEMSALLTPLMAIAVLAVAVLSAFAVRRNDPLRVVPQAALAFVLVLIVFNKVGSPQFHIWLLVPCLWGLVELGRGFRVQTVLALICGALTQTIYPYLYVLLLGLNPAMLVVISLRNLALVVFLGWQVRELLRLARTPSVHRASRQRALAA